MKVIILAGGLGTRISEETYNKPKPMVKIGKMPILWHIMKIYSAQGYKDFIICGGYKQKVIKNFFLNLKKPIIKLFINNKYQAKKSKKNYKAGWNVNIVDTGINSNTGERLKKLKKILHKENNFFFTYGDGLANINLKKLLSFHKKQKTVATLTAITPPSRFGVLKFKGNKISRFLEKRDFEKDYLVNGGFFVFSKQIFKYLRGKNPILEKNTLEFLSTKGQLSGFKHKDFWFSMDTQRDHIFLNNLWVSKKSPWKIW